MWLVRLFIFIKFELFHFTFFPNTKAYRFAEGESKKHLESQVKDEKLRESLQPGFAYGCKRVLFHNEYYPTLQLSNVTVHRGGIKEISGQNLTGADGTTNRLDVLILATGFKASNYLDPLKLVGTEGANINALWKKDKPSSYLGIITNSAPNHFFLLGPNTLLGHSSVIFMIECQVGYIVQAIRKMMEAGVKGIKPKKDVEESYMAGIEKDLEKTIWHQGNCEAWYTDAKGSVTALYPYNCITYWRSTRKFNLNNYETY